MGFIIIGGIVLVIIMVITSTKIKKNAALAFDREMVEKEDFRLEKPEGFLYPLNSDSGFPFEAYSKTYGDKETRNIWRARIRLRTSEGLNLHKLVNEIKSSNENFISEKEFDDLPERQKGTIIRTEKTEDEIGYKILRKVLQNKNRKITYELKTTILEPYGEEFADRACEMMQSFVVK